MVAPASFDFELGNATSSDKDDMEAIEALATMRPAFPVASVRPVLFSAENNIALPPNFKMTKCDVINGRGRKSYNHIGNRRFRLMAAMNLKRYYEAESKADKSLVVSGLVQAIRESCPSGGFLKLDSKRNIWLSVGGRETREKAGHCFRDMIAAIRDDDRKRDQLDLLTAPRSCEYPLRKPKTTFTLMTSQQQLVLQRLESGFDGSVEDLMREDVEE